MGANGKVGDVLNIDRVVRDNVAVIKRFTGGGTVALGKDAVLTSIISSRVSLLA
jgi:lipoate-protein ligase A